MVNIDTFSGIEHTIQVIQITKWCHLSSLVMYLYELLITFDDEVMLIWLSPFSYGKILFLFLRYFTLMTLLFINIVLFLREVPTNVRLAWTRFQWTAGSIIGFLSHLTLELRLFAMFSKCKTVVTTLVASTVATAGSMCGIYIKIMVVEKAVFVNLGKASEHNMCFHVNVPILFKYFWIPCLIAELILVVLALYKAVQTNGIMLHRWWSEKGHYGFLRFLVRDSILFFWMVFIPFLANQLVWVFGGADYIEVTLGIGIASASIWSQRLLLNIRKHRQTSSEDVSVRVTLSSDIPSSSGTGGGIVLGNLKKMEFKSVNSSAGSSGSRTRTTISKSSTKQPV
ncbi:uncharacterized protein FOMMEDRAFT_147311 [Fomitiporia mediterranea MF3/22]|uniref:uncharacterized protein n=1 Tax=Fomitiporia mediterranea (strain MF3/22) TaxID=694068 RepID=UPI00044095B8|nr:uncharacterized protein FOMMEDRAFT_147311 [Fomitiporia mediterranea MF3/22]EJD02293.1 hypothetical protein FOMMEDRAFT_147311 [Fomitiporia mediterranea MF3/22]